ncbi:glycosyl hydrolase [Gemmatimonadetes bacterium T265]|nr:glycosyl hydrolase [Gemmatimonadetes bacterium T265]
MSSRWLATLPFVAGALVAAHAGDRAARGPSAPRVRRDGCTVTLLDSAAQPGSAWAPPAVAREFRGAWVSPVESGEWPSRTGMSDAEQQTELQGLLDRAAAIGLNAVILHVRPAADALYPTTRAPWSSYLVGRGGVPGYDPLAYAVREAHRRGLQLHVWFNPFRAAPPDRREPAGAQRIAGQHPEWLVRYGSQRWIDPGFPEARKDVLGSLFEVVDRYDIDALHLDDYFYPYREEETVTRRVRVGRRVRRVRTTETIAFDDARSWARYGAGEDRAAWRRENVSDFVRQLYAGVKARKPWVLVGISPFGIWRPGSPAGVSGLDAYEEIYADSRRWLREGWVDYLAPQLYWASDGEQARFRRLDAWWRGENSQRRHVWPGLLTMRVAEGHNKWPASEIAHEIELLRAARAPAGESQGHVHFRLKSLLADAAGALGDRLAGTLYAAPALPPASPWLDATVPAAPRFAGCAAVGGTAAGGAAAGGGAADVLTVAAGDSTRVRWWLASWRDARGGWTTRVLPGETPLVSARFRSGEDADAVAVAAVSATGVVGPSLVLRPGTAVVGAR